MKHTRVLLFSLLLLSLPIFAQNYEQKSGTNLIEQSRGALYDLSDPYKVNFRVAIWGAVPRPGNYIVPSGTTVVDLISFAGGPTINALLDQLKIYRTLEDSTQVFYKYNLDELYTKEEKKSLAPSPQLKPTDVVLLPGEPKLFYKDYLSLYLSAGTTLLSMAILLITWLKR